MLTKKLYVLHYSQHLLKQVNNHQSQATVDMCMNEYLNRLTLLCNDIKQFVDAELVITNHLSLTK